MKLFEFDQHIGDWRVLVQSRDIQNGAIQSRHISSEAVTTDKIGDGEVKSRNIATEAVTTDKIGDREVKARNIAKEAVTTEKIADEAITGDEIEGNSIKYGKIANDAVQTRNIKDRNVTSPKIALNAILPEHVSPATFRELSKDLQNQIDSLEIAGIALSNELGDNPHIGISQKKISEEVARLNGLIDTIQKVLADTAVSNEFGQSTTRGVSQKTLTEALNKLWQKIEDMTGEVLQGISMSVTPDYFISEDGCSVHISANTVETNGIFEHIAFYANGTLIAEADNVDYFDHDFHVDETTVIMCKAKILGVEYTRQHVITHYNSFWLGAGAAYSDIMDVEHVIPITNGMRGAYNVDVAQGQHIIIIVGESLAAGFLRADLNSVEINFTESTVTVDGKNYKVFTSEEVYSAGTYNIDING